MAHTYTLKALLRIDKYLKKYCIFGVVLFCSGRAGGAGGPPKIQLSSSVGDALHIYFHRSPQRGALCNHTIIMWCSTIKRYK
jgi:hypothetical protein